MLRYGGHPSQYGELTLPGSPGPWPVVVLLHGGFWRPRYGADIISEVALELSGHGLACWNLEYRRVGDDPVAGGGGWPNTCLDVAAGTDLLASDGQRAADGQLDLSRVVAVGHSAGGHLAGWLAGRSTVPAGAPGASPGVPVTGLVSLAGVLDLEQALADDLGSGAVRDFLGRAADDPDALELASPRARVPLGVPAVCVHGTDDDDVPLNQSERFVAAAVRAGDDARLVAIEGADHFAAMDFSSPTWAACLTGVLDLTGTGA
jgi:acetyl esterase/lipase